VQIFIVCVVFVDCRCKSCNRYEHNILLYTLKKELKDIRIMGPYIDL
jgi:hypothetical protein